jgi:hypothetical protein
VSAPPDVRSLDGTPSGRPRTRGRKILGTRTVLEATTTKEGASMSENDNESTTVAEDLNLEGSEADAVVGGRTSKMNSQIHHLESEGWVESACTREGIQMFNPKTKQHKMVKFA